MEDFYNSGIINAVTNETLICLILKKKDSVKLKDYRPKSLVTSLYKAVSKVPATRLKEVLGETTHANQGAFVKNRQILDVVLVANEAVQDAMKLNKSRLVFKIDFDHAYDHVEWRVVDDVMGKFKTTRGVRQGDLLSPFLFSLVIDVLSRLMEKAQEYNLLHGLFIRRDKVEVSHLQFADDTIFLLGVKE
ncbi:uncharacterized protein LOC110772737 [Prunus avium]|uniref:Uncharacterized protein LOC110772737 n=1 Tax=Prunus avium TaxID=42229 RepID=A0A6P5TYP8_PRUAV|nr:uncharacterized protein LOC110772737 [Prunus avium]